MDTMKTSLPDLRTLIAQLKEHRANLKDTPASIEDRPLRHGHFNQDGLILHLCKQRPPGPIPPLESTGLGWKCPQCKAWLVTGKCIKAHMDKVAKGISCASLQKHGRGRISNAKVRGMIGDSDRWFDRHRRCRMP